MTRKETLIEAERCVCGQREEDYGSPEENFGVIAEMWSVYLDQDISAEDVANLMILLKVARAKSRFKADNYIDICGYAACSCEIGSANKISDPFSTPNASLMKGVSYE